MVISCYYKGKCRGKTAKRTNLVKKTFNNIPTLLIAFQIFYSHLKNLAKTLANKFVVFKWPFIT